VSFAIRVRGFVKKIYAILGLVTLSLGVSVAASAQSTPAPAMSPVASPAPSPTPTATPTPKVIQFSGFADAGYTSHTGSTSLQFTNGGNSRVFDYIDHQPALQNLNIAAALNAGALGGKLELSMGSDADIIAAYPAAFNGFDLTQAYLSYTSGPFTLIGGKFETLAGAEVIESPSNTNFSRSILFGFAVPFTHTGARLTFAPNSKISAILGVNAGWDDMHDTNGQRTVEYGIALNPSAAFSLTAQGYTGFEQISNVPLSTVQGQRKLIDIVGTYHANPKLTFVANYDHGFQQNAPILNAAGATVSPFGTAGWSGLAGYGSYQVDPRTTASVRYESFHDAAGYRTGFAQTWREGTLTLGYAPSSSVLFRGEFRRDTSDQPVFAHFGVGAPASSTGSFGFEAIVKY
jgi:hypothetical protein